jgi:hypothetical protein
MFSIKETAAHTGRNPRTGTQMYIPAGTHVQIRPGKVTQARLDLEKTNPERQNEQLLRAPWTLFSLI